MRSALKENAVGLELYSAGARRRPVGAGEPDGLTIRLYSNGWPFAIPDDATACLSLNGSAVTPLQIVDRAEGKLRLEPRPAAGSAVVTLRYGEFEMPWQKFELV